MSYLQWDKWMASSRCEKRDRLEPHVCCTADSLGYWHALHRAIHIRIRRCSERLRSFLCSLMLRDYSAGCTTVWSYRKALIWICCQHTVWCMDHSIWNMNLRGCMLLVTAQPHLGLKWHRTGLLTKCCKKKKTGRKKKKIPTRLSVYSLHSGLFIQSEKTV